MESGDNPADLHLTGKQAGVAAAEAGARRLVLTHIPPWHDPDVPLAEAARGLRRAASSVGASPGRRTPLG